MYVGDFKPVPGKNLMECPDCKKTLDLDLLEETWCHPSIGGAPLGKRWARYFYDCPHCGMDFEAYFEFDRPDS